MKDCIHKVGDLVRCKGADHLGLLEVKEVKWIATVFDYLEPYWRVYAGPPGHYDWTYSVVETHFKAAES